MQDMGGFFFWLQRRFIFGGLIDLWRRILLCQRSCWWGGEEGKGWQLVLPRGIKPHALELALQMCVPVILDLIICTPRYSTSNQWPPALQHQESGHNIICVAISLLKPHCQASSWSSRLSYHSLGLQRLEKHKLRKFAQLICKLQQAAVHH